MSTGTLMDHRIGIKRESTFGTPVTVDRFYPYMDGSKAEWDPRRRGGKGVVSGGVRTQLASRSFLPTGQGTITIQVELEDVQAGVMLDLAFGVSTVTTITGGASMVFHPGVTGTLLPSATIQFVQVQNDGTDFVETYAGCTASKVTIEQPQDDIATLTVVFDAGSYTTATAAATKSYTAGSLYDAYMGSCGYAGSLTVPTTTALATGLTAFNDIRSWKVDLDHKIDVGRWNINAGTRAQPTVGMPDIKWSASVEFNATTIPAAFKAGTVSGWYQTWTNVSTLGAGVTKAQMVIPKLALTKGMPDGKIGQTGLVAVEAEVLNDGTNKDCYFVYQSTDTAL